MVSLAPLLRKTAGCGFAFGPCLITLPVCYVAHSSASAEMAGYRAKALDGTSSAYDETAANQRFSSPNLKICIPLITVLITSVNTITLLHNLFSGERVTP